MIISIILLFCLAYLNKNYSTQRLYICLLAFIVYVGYSIFDLWWLLDNYNWPFHPSDPTRYYKEIIGKNFTQVISLEGSNTFYFIINWIYWKNWDDSTSCSIIMRLNNILAYLTCYSLAIDKKKRICLIDFLLLFNPFIIITIVRNVRDIYIILFVLITLIGLGTFPKKYKNNYFLSIGGFCLLIITRAIMILPIILDWYVQIKTKLSRSLKVLILSACCSLFVIFISSILHSVANQMISAIQYVGEDIEPYVPLLNGQFPLFTLKSVFYRLFIGAISILFTPHPLNFLSEWTSSPDLYDIVGIYTYPDNCMILLGSVFNYILVIPLVFLAATKYKQLNRGLLIFTLSFILLYVVSFLGTVDIRNRNTMFFFMLLTIYYSNIKVNIPIKCYIATLLVFGGIYFVSS